MSKKIRRFEIFGDYGVKEFVLSELFPKEVRNTRCVVKEIVRKYGWVLEFVNERLQNEREIVVEAVRDYGSSLEFTSEELKNDEEIVLEAVKQDGVSLEFACEELRNNRNIVFEAVKQNGSSLEFASEELRNDKEVVLNSCRNSPCSLEFASERLRRDREIILEVLSYSSNNAPLIYSPGRDEYSVFSHLKFVSEELRNDREIVLEYVKRDGLSLKFASKRLRGDKEIVLEAIKHCEFAFVFALKELQNDEEFVLEAVKSMGLVLKRVGKHFQSNREIVLEAVKENGCSLDFAGDSMKGDIEIVLNAVKSNGYSLKYSSDHLKNDKEIVLEAVKSNSFSLEFASEKMQNDREIVLEAVKQNGNLLKFASERLRNKKEVVVEAMKQKVDSLQFAGDRIRNDRDFFVEWCCHDRSIVQFIGSVLERNSVLFKLMKIFEGDVEKIFEKYTKFNSIYFEEEGISIEWKIWEEMALRIFLISSQRLARSTVIGEIDEESEIEEMNRLREHFEGFRVDEVVFFRFLGSGAFASTYLCSLRGEVLVAKFYRSPFLGKKKKEELLRRDCVPIPYHPHIVPILGYKAEESIELARLPDYDTFWKKEVDIECMNNSGLILMKYHRLSLGTYLRKRKKIYAGEAIGILESLLRGMEHLNLNYIVHRDLHLENIFVDDTNGRVWVGDFGCALDLREKRSFIVSKDDEILYSLTYWGNNYRSEMNIAGNSSVVAPEIRKACQGKDCFVNYSKSDIFLVGKVGKILEEKWPFFFFADRDSEKDNGKVMVNWKKQEAENFVKRLFKELNENLVEKIPKERIDYRYAIFVISKLKLCLQGWEEFQKVCELFTKKGEQDDVEEENDDVDDSGECDEFPDNISFLEPQNVKDDGEYDRMPDLVSWDE